jgi:hypothetical protein
VSEPARQGADRLAQVIAQHEAAHPADNHAKAVLARLKASRDVAKAFAATCPDDDRCRLLLNDCITAERETRQHAERVNACRDTVKMARDTLKKLASVGKYLGLESEPARPHNDLIRQAYEVLVLSVKTDRTSAQDWLKRVSRETTPAAARQCGIGWIKESVATISGRPNLRHVTALAEITLDVELTPDMVDKAIGPHERRIHGSRKPRTRDKKID